MTEPIIIAAVSENGVIGNRMRIPWHSNTDTKRLRERTDNASVIMGRETFERNWWRLRCKFGVVLSRDSDMRGGSKIYVAHSIEEALDACEERGYLDTHVIGGAETYEQFLPKTKLMDITHVKKQVDGNAYFPKVNWEEWKEISYRDTAFARYSTYLRK
jgi:dihydrofolate reductase